MEKVPLTIEQVFDNQFTRRLHCEKCKSITDHEIALKSARDNGVYFLRACHDCHKKNVRNGNEVYPWTMDSTTIQEWNIIIENKYL